MGCNIGQTPYRTNFLNEIQEHLTSERYQEILENPLEEFLENLPLIEEQRLYFQQDGAPSHNAHHIMDYLRLKFGQRLIATNGPVRWPPRSPDLTPLDFFLWGHIKNLVYSTPPTTLEILKTRIREAFANIRIEQLQNVVQENIYRVRKCNEVQGGYFENLIGE